MINDQRLETQPCCKSPASSSVNSRNVISVWAVDQIGIDPPHAGAPTNSSHRQKQVIVGAWGCRRSERDRAPPRWPRGQRHRHAEWQGLRTSLPPLVGGKAGRHYDESLVVYRRDIEGNWGDRGGERGHSIRTPTGALADCPRSPHRPSPVERSVC